MLEFIGLCTILFVVLVFLPELFVLAWNILKIVAVLAVILTVFILLGM